LSMRLPDNAIIIQFVFSENPIRRFDSSRGGGSVKPRAQANLAQPNTNHQFRSSFEHFNCESRLPLKVPFVRTNPKWVDVTLRNLSQAHPCRTILGLAVLRLEAQFHRPAKPYLTN
jgi:hypothetical protein